MQIIVSGCIFLQTMFFDVCKQFLSFFAFANNLFLGFFISPTLQKIMVGPLHAIYTCARRLLLMQLPQFQALITENRTTSLPLNFRYIYCFIYNVLYQKSRDFAALLLSPLVDGLEPPPALLRTSIWKKKIRIN